MSNENLREKIATISYKWANQIGQNLKADHLQCADEIIRQIKNYAKEHGWTKRQMLCEDYKNGKCSGTLEPCENGGIDANVCCIDCKKYRECEVSCIYVDFTQTELSEEDFK